jgi:predicted metallo-beta-lactamase superfamily hydrolase
LTDEEFVNVVNKVVTLSANHGMVVVQMANFIPQKELELEKLNGELEDTKVKQLQVLRDYNI